MATNPPVTKTDAEVVSEMDALMDRLCPKSAEATTTLPKGKPFAESMGLFIELRKKAGSWLPDEDFARDVEEGRKLLREPSSDRWE